MPSHLALLSCLLVLLLSLDKFLLHYLKRWLSGGGGSIIPRIPTGAFRPRSHRPMAAAGRWSETAMLVIDMQKDFVDPAMGSPVLVAGGEAVVPAVAEAVAVARERGIFVVWVVREHDPSGRDVELFRRHLYSGGKGPTVKGLKGAELADGLFIKEGDYKLVKTRFSAFFATHLDSVLKTQGIKNLVIVGVQTPNCIRQTVYDAVELDYEKVMVLIDATAAARPDIHLANIRDMKTIGVETPTLEEWRR
ncbi:probable inactive nicotinamidase At3g16190 [Triticum urartu]|uniref:Isochorismatase-like domain-containing protein n=1 Tax=Triticum urartu TaxID=4572 RepID=A0A8R7VCT7_TRIUA|nr:probable inactive nicotinamidase At3g16190 [Triticum urartu]